jgi:hypothetical protein
VSQAEPAEAMLARVRAGIEQQGMMATLGAELMTALYGLPGVSG